LESTGIKSFLSGFGDKIGGAIAGVFGGGSDAIGGAAGAAGSIGSAAGGGGSAAGAAGAFNWASIIGGALGGAISAIGSMRLEGTMNAVEHNTRYTYIEIADMMSQILQPIKNYIQYMAEVGPGILPAQLNEITVWLGDIHYAIVNELRALARPMNVPQYATGGPTVAGLSMLHDNEYVVPRGGALVMSGDGETKEILREIARYLKGGRPVNIHMDGRRIATGLTDSVRNGGVELFASRLVK
jgi:hypothetical protein